MIYFVDVGEIVRVKAATPRDAAMLALFAHNSSGELPETLTVYADVANATPNIFTLDALPCRICGCTERRACKGGCAWAVPGICTRCFVPPPATSPSYAMET